MCNTLAPAKGQKRTIIAALTRREHNKLLRQRGRLRLRKIDHSPATSNFNYWHDWECIRAEWTYLLGGGWQRESVLRAYRRRINSMRATRLGFTLFTCGDCLTCPVGKGGVDA